MKSCNGKILVPVMLSLIFGLSAVLFCTGWKRSRVEKITYTDTAMGTIVQQTLYIDMADIRIKEREKTLAAEEVMDVVENLEQETLSWRTEDSEIYEINASAGLGGYAVSKKMREYLRCIDTVWSRSCGALDITLGKITQLWRIDEWANSGQEGFELPSEKSIEEALADCGFDKIKKEHGKIYLPTGIQLDLGAVGKGIACDSVREYLKSRKEIMGGVISIGGSVLTYGEKPDGSSWKIGIRHPREEGASIVTLQLKGGLCVSTSGDYERYVEKDGMRYHHIMDPGTGYPADSGIISVTIVSDNGCLSDALSTACFVLGAEDAVILAESFGAQAYIIDSKMQVFMTEGMDKMIVLQ